MSDNGNQEPVERICPFWGQACSDVNAPDVPEEQKCGFLAHIKGKIPTALGVPKDAETDMCMFQLNNNIQGQLLQVVNRLAQMIGQSNQGKPIDPIDQLFRR